MNIIEAKRLTKKFNGFTAVDGINLQVEEGELFGLLGPNGAGKSTTMYMLSTVLAPSSGTALVNGFDIVSNPVEVRKSIGMVFQDSTLDTYLTGFDNLDIHGRLYGVESATRKQRIEEVLQLVELQDWAGKLVKTYSGGMRRRLEIARGLLHTPKVLFLDEPTLGLDPQTRRHIWDYLVKLKKRGVSMILTTHYLEEADVLCDRIAIIDHGKIMALDTPQALKKNVGESVVYVQSVSPQKLSRAFGKAGYSNSVSAEGVVAVHASEGETLVPKFMEIARKARVEVKAVELRKPSLEDVFLHYTGRSLRDAGDSSAEKKMFGRAFARHR